VVNVLSVNLLLCRQVDLSVFDPAALIANSTAADQVTVADVLVGSKADAAAPGAAAALQQWAAEELFPPKQEVSTHDAAVQWFRQLLGAAAHAHAV
jgi:G3E family GTPase